MGSWGSGPFDNDGALDWLDDAGGVAELRDTLATVAAFAADEYLDVDDGNAATAAAEIVAAALAPDDGRVAPTASAWLAASPGAIEAADRDLARRALERVLARNSELVGLWDDYGFETEWHAKMRRLLARLGGDPAAVALAARGLTETRSEPLSEEKRMAWEESLLLQLRARGLEPTEAQLARIRASRDGIEFSRWYQRADEADSVDEVLDAMCNGLAWAR